MDEGLHGQEGEHRPVPHQHAPLPKARQAPIARRKGTQVYQREVQHATGDHRRGLVVLHDVQQLGHLYGQVVRRGPAQRLGVAVEHVHRPGPETSGVQRQPMHQ